MSAINRGLVTLLVCALAASTGRAQDTCPTRPNPGSVVSNPPDLYSQNGVLNANFTFRSSFDTSGYLHECYISANLSGAQPPVEAPTLRLNAGDQLILNLTNRLTYVPSSPPRKRSAMSMPDMGSMTSPTTPRDACSGGTMTATSTNIHFHGLNIPPVCHQDEILMTTVENTDPPFQYNLQIPKNDAPGMYWYHPHLHGEVTLQVNGGSPGVFIINGIENVKPQVAGLPERVLVIRQQFTNPNSWLAGPSQLTLNYQPAIYPLAPSPILQMKPGAKEFWRVANATSQAFLALQIWFGDVPQNLELIALDGIPVKESSQVTTIDIPPAGRAEFIMQGPPANQEASFQQIGFNTGPIGNPNLPQQLAVIQTSPNAQEPTAIPAARVPAPPPTPLRFAGLAAVTPTAKRKIYFAEATNGSNGPTEFFITPEGQTPKVFSMSDPPSITTTVGAVEDWTIENRSGEVHAFHIHQIHFLFLAVNGAPFSSPELRDTVIVPAWNGTGAYPTVTLRMDFRDPEIAGRFVYHCHILDHEDAGMMSIIQVNSVVRADPR